MSIKTVSDIFFVILTAAVEIIITGAYFYHIHVGYRYGLNGLVEYAHAIYPLGIILLLVNGIIMIIIISALISCLDDSDSMANNWKIVCFTADLLLKISLFVLYYSYRSNYPASYRDINSVHGMLDTCFSLKGGYFIYIIISSLIKEIIRNNKLKVNKREQEAAKIEQDAKAIKAETKEELTVIKVDKHRHHNQH